MMTPTPSAPASLEPLRRLARACLSTIPVGLWRLLAPKDIVTLNYHVVSDEELPHQLLYAYKTPAQFERDVEYIERRAIGYQQASAQRRGEARLPEGRFLVTFDDGFSQCFDVARPILSRHGVPGLFFVNTAFLDDRRPFFEATLSTCLRAVAGLEVGRATDVLGRLRADRGASSVDPERNLERALERLRGARVRLPADEPYRALALWVLGLEEDDQPALARAAEMVGLPAPGSSAERLFLTSDQVRQMAAEGFALGSHGITHVPMQRLGPEEMERQIVESCATVRDLTGQKRVPFAFPYSGSGIDRTVLAEIRRRHPFVDLFFDTQAFQRDAPFVVQRIAADLPPAPDRNRSNVPDILKITWSRRSAWYRDGTGGPANLPPHGSHAR